MDFWEAFLWFVAIASGCVVILYAVEAVVKRLMK